MGCLIALVLALISMYLSASHDTSVGLSGEYTWDDGRPVLDMRRQGKVEGRIDKDSVGGKVSRTWNNGRTEVEASVDYNFRNRNTNVGVGAQHTSKNGLFSVGGYYNRNVGGPSQYGVGVNFLYPFGRPVLNLRRQWKVEGRADRDSVGVEGSRTWNSGRTEVKASVDHNLRNHNTAVGVGAQHTSKDGRFSVGGYYNRNVGGHSQTSAGVNFGWNFGRPVLNMRRQLDLQRFVNPVSVSVRDNPSWNARLLPKRLLDVEEVADFDDPPPNRWFDYEPARLWVFSQ